VDVHVEETFESTSAGPDPCRGILGPVESRPSSSYHEFAPPARLAPYVQCLWIHRIGTGEVSYDQPVLPDACIDLVAMDGSVQLAGPATRSTTLTLAPGSVIVGVRFLTGAAPSLVGVGASEIRDLDVPLGSLWGRSGEALTNEALETSPWRARLGVMVDGLVGRLDQARMLDPVSIGVAATLADAPERPISQLAYDIGLSERQLRRRVEDAVGYSPRTLARILRFQRFLRAARALGPGRHLARLAVEAGYADQAHLTRDCRELSGLPPGALLRWEAERLST
jgi:AraC-like DNA-binding protein